MSDASDVSTAAVASPRRRSSRLAAWAQASRPLAHANLAPGLLFGQALAYAQTGAFSWARFAAVALFGVLDQLFIVFGNDVADAEADAKNPTPTPFSGGSRVVPEGKLAPRDLARAARWAAAGLTFVLAALVVTGARGTLLLAAPVAIGLLLAYSFGPRLSYRGGGEWLQTAGVGVVLPFVGFAAQAPAAAPMPWAALGPPLCFAFAGHLATALPDLAADAAVGKRTWAVRHGARACKLHASFVALAGVALAGVALAGGALESGALGSGASQAAMAAPTRDASALWAVVAPAGAFALGALFAPVRGPKSVLAFVLCIGGCTAWTLLGLSAALVLARGG